MSDAATANPPVLVPFLKFDSAGAPYLEGHKCGNCGTVYTSERVACSKCFARGGFETVRLPTTGTLYTFSIVHRSYPGIPVPFISATVDLDGTCSLKGTLIDVEPDTEQVHMGMPVEIVFKELEYRNKDGQPYISYFFRPRAA